MANKGVMRSGSTLPGFLQSLFQSPLPWLSWKMKHNKLCSGMNRAKKKKKTKMRKHTQKAQIRPSFSCSLQHKAETSEAGVIGTDMLGRCCATGTRKWRVFEKWSQTLWAGSKQIIPQVWLSWSLLCFTCRAPEAKERWRAAQDQWETPLPPTLFNNSHLTFTAGELSMCARKSALTTGLVAPCFIMPLQLHKYDMTPVKNT